MRAQHCLVRRTELGGKRLCRTRRNAAKRLSTPRSSCDRLPARSGSLPQSERRRGAHRRKWSRRLRSGESYCSEEGRVFVHPFEGKHTALGTATLATGWIARSAGQACFRFREAPGCGCLGSGVLNTATQIMQHSGFDHGQHRRSEAAAVGATWRIHSEATGAYSARLPPYSFPRDFHVAPIHGEHRTHCTRS